MGWRDTITTAAAPTASNSPSAQPTGDAPTAALEHFGNNLSFHQLPKLQAATEGPMDAVLDQLYGTNVSGDLPSYDQRVNQNVTRIKQEAKDHPTASRVGDLAADAVMTGLGGAAVSKGFGLAKKAVPALGDIPWGDVGDFATSLVPDTTSRLAITAAGKIGKAIMASRAARLAAQAGKAVAPVVEDAAPTIADTAAADTGAAAKVFDPFTKRVVGDVSAPAVEDAEPVVSDVVKNAIKKRYDPFLKTYVQ